MDIVDVNFTALSIEHSNVDSLPRYVLLSMAILIGLPGIFFNALIAYIKTKYSKQYKSPTYIFMVQLAVADIFVLVCVSMGTAIFILFRQLPTKCRFLHDFFAFVLNFGWHPGCCFLCFIVYSRYVILCVGNDKLDEYFSQRKIRIYIIFSWLAMGAIYSVQFYNPDGGSLTRWSAEILSWGNDIETGLLGKLLLILTLSQSYVSFVFIGFYNLRILFWLHKVRHSVTMVDNSRLFKQEVKLFLQSLITGTCFMGVIATYVALNVFTPKSHRSIWCYLWLDFIWLMNASINPLIYCMLNRTLRQHVYSLMTCTKIVGDTSRTAWQN